jgi:hypothetical protein
VKAKVSNYTLVTLLDIYEILVVINAAYPRALRNVSTVAVSSAPQLIQYSFLMVSMQAGIRFKRFMEELLEGTGRLYHPDFEIHPATHARLRLTVEEEETVRWLRPGHGTYEDSYDFGQYYLLQLEESFIRDFDQVDTINAFWRVVARAAHHRRHDWGEYPVFTPPDRPPVIGPLK